jgi:hypothetical protein
VPPSGTCSRISAACDYEYAGYLMDLVKCIVEIREKLLHVKVVINVSVRPHIPAMNSFAIDKRFCMSEIMSELEL